MEKKFRMVLEQWSLPRDNMEKWRSGWIREAEKWKDKIPNANLILDLARKEER